MEEHSFVCSNLMSFLFSLLGLVTSLVDIGLDVLTVRSFYQTGDYVYMAVMIILLLGSSVLVHMFSWLWYTDSLEQLQTQVEKSVNRHHLLKAFHVVQLGVFVRYAGQLEISICRFLLQSDRSPQHVNKLKRDLCMLRLIEAFSENAPQLTLMMSIIAMRQELQLYTGLKTLVSAAAIAFSVVKYHQSTQKFLHEQCKLSWTSSGVYFLCNLFFILPRVTALALFTSVLPCYIIAHFLSIWMILVLGVWSQKTNFMKDSCWEWLYRATIGLIWYFSWFNVGSRCTKLRTFVYYIFMGLDTMILLGFWYWRMEHACISILLQRHIVIYVLAGLCILGILLIIIYYKKLHPTCDKEKIGDSHEPAVPMRAAAAVCGDLAETDSAQDVSPEAPALTQPVTGPERRMRIMAANFYY